LDSSSAVSWLLFQKVGTSVLNRVVGCAEGPWAGYRTAALKVPCTVFPVETIDATRPAWTALTK
jgi:hypothetical protein